MSLSQSKRIAEFMVFILLLIASPCIVFGGTIYERESLKGMSGVSVSVSVKDKSLETHGITEAMLITDVEVKLRVARIKVFDDPNDPDGNRAGRPELHVNVHTTKFDPAAVYIIDVTLTQDAVLDRGKIPVRATTWKSLGYAYGGVDNAHTNVRKNLGDSVDTFINDYLAVNPK